MSDPFVLQRRCERTKNLCGTDTWGAKPCPCDQCQSWLMEESIVKTHDDQFPFKPDQPTVTVLDKSHLGALVAANLVAAKEIIKLRDENTKLQDQLLAESMKTDEVRELEAVNHAANEAARKLLDIANNGRSSGAFGGTLMEECAQAILKLRCRMEVLEIANNRLRHNLLG